MYKEVQNEKSNQSGQNSPTTTGPARIRAGQEAMQIGSEIRTAREHKGMTQSELAEAAKTTRQQIAKWEHGTQDITVKRLERIATVLGCKFVIGGK